MRLPSTRRLPRPFYGWYIAWAGAGTNFLLGFTTYGFGVFIEEFRTDFGWSLKAIALGFSLLTVQTGLMSPFTGIFLDRIGPRKMAVTGVLITAAALFGMSRMNGIGMFYICLLAIALGQSFGGWGAYNTALLRWFRQKRGRALAVLSVGIGAGYFTAVILAGLLGWLDWRQTMLVVAVTILVVGVPLALVIRDYPKELGMTPDGATAALVNGGTRGGAQADSGMEVRESLKVPAFYLIGLASIAGQVAHGAFITFSIPHLQNAGFSRGSAGLFVAAYGVAQVAARFAAGWLGDSFGRRRVYIAGFACMAVGMIAFSFISPQRLWLMPLVTLVYGLGNAAWIIGASTTPADYFGTKRFATIRGLMQSMAVPITLGIPLFMGATFDRLGSYQLGYFVLAFGALTGALWMLLVRRATWERPPLLAPSPAAARAGAPGAGRQ